MMRSCTKSSNEIIHCIIKGKPLVLSWGRTSRLDSGVRVSKILGFPDISLISVSGPKWDPRQGTRYKLVITIQDDNKEMNCVLFNSYATLLLGYTIDELITKSIMEGVGNPDWIVDHFIDSLIAKWVVLEIKIDSYNLSPTYVRMYTVTKYYGDDVNALNKHSRSSSSSTKTMVYSDVNIPSSLNDVDMTDYVIDDKYMGSTINENEEKMMDDLMWGQNDASVEDAKVENYQVDKSEVDDVVVSEPQVDEVHVDDA
ncbi:replication factor A protein 1 [Tanacetum coccineum]